MGGSRGPIPSNGERPTMPNRRLLFHTGANEMDGTNLSGYQRISDLLIGKKCDAFRS